MATDAFRPVHVRKTLGVHFQARSGALSRRRCAELVNVGLLRQEKTKETYALVLAGLVDAEENKVVAQPFAVTLPSEIVLYLA